MRGATPCLLSRALCGHEYIECESLLYCTCTESKDTTSIRYQIKSSLELYMCHQSSGARERARCRLNHRLSCSSSAPSSSPPPWLTTVYSSCFCGVVTSLARTPSSCVCVCVCVRARARACVRACVRVRALAWRVDTHTCGSHLTHASKRGRAEARKQQGLFMRSISPRHQRRSTDRARCRSCLLCFCASCACSTDGLASSAAPCAG